jgi:hypothetical protein
VQFTLIIQLMLHMRWDPYSDRNLNAVHCPTPYPTILCSRSRDPLHALHGVNTVRSSANREQ